MMKVSTETAVLALVLVASCVVVFVAWRRLRLRRAFFAVRNQVVWSIRHAPPDKFVLEVGSGHNPHIRSDVICDKFLYDNAHRSAGIVIDRPLVVGDAEALPFKSHVFDVIISSHMIEHLGDPCSFFNEAARVAHSGLFTAPSATRERLLGDLDHRWLIEKRGDVLHFVAKKRPVYDPAIRAFFAEEVARNVCLFDDFILDHWKSLEIVFLWQGQPECVVEGKPFSPGNAGPYESPVVKRSLTGLEVFRDHLRRLIRRMVHVFLSSCPMRDWADILACPKCHGDVVVSASDVYCPACDLHFPVDHGVPIMLLDRAVAGQPLEGALSAPAEPV